MVIISVINLAIALMKNRTKRDITYRLNEMRTENRRYSGDKQACNLKVRTTATQKIVNLLAITISITDVFSQVA